MTITEFIENFLPEYEEVYREELEYRESSLGYRLDKQTKRRFTEAFNEMYFSDALENFVRQLFIKRDFLQTYEVVSRRIPYISSFSNHNRRINNLDTYLSDELEKRSKGLK